jgi:ABC-type sugar transport system permease subunit
LLPALAVFLLFTYYPLLRVLYLSFTDADLLRPPRWVGLENYHKMLMSREFLGSLSVTTVFALAVTALEVGIGMALAFLMQAKTRFQSLLRGAIFAPVVVSTVSAALIWQYMMNPNGGPLNAGLQALGLPPLGWLTRPETALASVILISFWKGVGLPAVIYLAGLQAIPKELQEAARVDGATAWQVARRITIPLLTPTTMVVLFLSLVGTFQSYGLILVLRTEGGPVGATNLLGYHIYQNAFQYFQMGYACAVSVFLFLLLAGLAWIQFRLSERRVHYQ